MSLQMDDELKVFDNYRQAIEFEKKRIAAELHDTSLQTLAHLTHKVEIASMYMDTDISRAKLEMADLNRQLKNVIDEIRNAIYELRPMTFDDLGLKDAIIRYISDLDAKSKISYSYELEDIELEDSLHTLELFRTIQELLKNCEKHSNAKNVSVNLIKKKKTRIEIVDDGDGFDVENILSNPGNHFGLSIAKDRIMSIGGDISIVSNIGTGTKVIISI